MLRDAIKNLTWKNVASQGQSLTSFDYSEAKRAVIPSSSN